MMLVFEGPNQLNQKLDLRSRQNRSIQWSSLALALGRFPSTAARYTSCDVMALHSMVLNDSLIGIARSMETF